MTPNVVLKTPRLVLREFAADDTPAVHAYAADTEVVRHLDRGPNAPEDTAGFLALGRATRDAVPRTKPTTWRSCSGPPSAWSGAAGSRSAARPMGAETSATSSTAGTGARATRPGDARPRGLRLRPPGAPPDLGHLRRRQPRLGAGPREARHAERRSSAAERPAEGGVARRVPLRHPRARLAGRVTRTSRRRRGFRDDWPEWPYSRLRTSDPASPVVHSKVPVIVAPSPRTVPATVHVTSARLELARKRLSTEGGSYRPTELRRRNLP